MPEQQTRTNNSNNKAYIFFQNISYTCPNSKQRCVRFNKHSCLPFLTFMMLLCAIKNYVFNDHHLKDSFPALLCLSASLLMCSLPWYGQTCGHLQAWQRPSLFILKYAVRLVLVFKFFRVNLFSHIIFVPLWEFMLLLSIQKKFIPRHWAKVFLCLSFSYFLRLF